MGWPELQWHWRSAPPRFGLSMALFGSGEEIASGPVIHREPFFIGEQVQNEK
jgi:hypothetical protein